MPGRISENLLAKIDPDSGETATGLEKVPVAPKLHGERLLSSLQWDQGVPS